MNIGALHATVVDHSCSVYVFVIEFYGMLKSLDNIGTTLNPDMFITVYLWFSL